MQNVSYFDTIYQEGNYETHYKVNIDGVDYGEDMIWSMKTSRRLFTENTPMIGNALVGIYFYQIMCGVSPYGNVYRKI